MRGAGEEERERWRGATTRYVEALLEPKVELSLMAAVVTKAEVVRVMVSGMFAGKVEDETCAQAMNDWIKRKATGRAEYGSEDSELVIAAMDWGDKGAILPPVGRPAKCGLVPGEGSKGKRMLTTRFIWWREEAEAMGDRAELAEGTCGGPGGTGSTGNEL
jgi:hypothetical protein